MHCPYCNTVNDDENSFCVSCGKTIPQDYKTLPNAMPPTQIYNQPSANEPDSVQTAYPPKPVFNQQQPNFNQQIPYQEPAKKSGKGLLVALLGIGILVVLGAIGAGGFYLWQSQQGQKTDPQKAEVLPDHLGMFVQNADKTAVSEIKKTDVTNALEQKENLMKDDSLPVWNENSSLILFSDAKEIPITDLKLVQLDSIEDDGKMKQIEFQAAPIDEKPQMKRLRFPNSLADGKYVLALFNGHLNDGTHKFWAFQVKDSKKSNNDDIAKETSLSINDKIKSEDKTEKKDSDDTEKKDTPAPTPKKDTKVPPPSGARVAYSNGSDVLLRGTPSLNGKKIGKLSKGQRIYIIYYSENYDEWRGTTANWAYVQTESGGRGWVFSPFVYY